MSERTETELVMVIRHVYEDGSFKVIEASCPRSDDTLRIQEYGGDSIWIPLASAAAFLEAVDAVLAHRLRADEEAAHAD